MKYFRLSFSIALALLASEQTPSAQAGQVIAIRGGTVLTVTRGTIQNGTIVLRDGKIAAVGGANTAIPSGADIVDAKGRFVTPGIIDAHSHIAAESINEGGTTDDRRSPMIVRTPVALHVGMADRPAGGDAYPNSLMGIMAFNRQAFLDAQWYQQAKPRTVSTALEAMQPAISGRMPVAFRASTARDVLRALDMAKSFKLDPIITAARQVEDVTADLKAANARVIYSMNFPVRRPSLAPDADESLSVLRDRANAPKGPSALDQAGILFAFESAGLPETKDFLKNAQKTVANGLSKDAAIKALTLNAATIAGAADRLGSLDKGKIANVIVTDGDLFDEKTAIKHVFVNGRPVTLPR